MNTNTFPFIGRINYNEYDVKYNNTVGFYCPRVPTTTLKDFLNVKIVWSTYKWSDLLIILNDYQRTNFYGRPMGALRYRVIPLHGYLSGLYPKNILISKDKRVHKKLTSWATDRIIRITDGKDLIKTNP